MVSKGDAFWTYSGGLAGVITASAGNDLYYPYQALIIGAIGTWIAYKMHFWVENRFKIDDAVGAVAVHGYAGFWGLVIAGFVLWGHPSSGFEGYASISPWGQFAGAIIMFWVLGFIPAWIVSKILQGAGVLRIPKEIEILGLDFGSMEEHAVRDREVAETELQHAS
jgi:ammonia channel protein AmtB